MTYAKNNHPALLALLAIMWTKHKHFKSVITSETVTAYTDIHIFMSKKCKITEFKSYEHVTMSKVRLHQSQLNLTKS